MYCLILLVKNADLEVSSQLFAHKEMACAFHTTRETTRAEAHSCQYCSLLIFLADSFDGYGRGSLGHEPSPISYRILTSTNSQETSSNYLLN